MNNAIERIAEEFLNLSDEKCARINELRLAYQQQIAAQEEASEAMARDASPLHRPSLKDKQ